ncbi:MAG: LysR family transcriptional regulator [Bacteriovoracia bacterium]
MKITFKDLQNFVACADSKTLSEASEKLGMAQPSLSLGIKKIETELGYPLFFRSKDGLKLTPQGKNLLPEAREVLVSLETIKGRKRTLKFRIGCHPSVGMFVLGEFLKLMNKASEEVDFEIVNNSSLEINKMVARGEIDFGVVMNPVSMQGLIIKSIGEDEVCVWESNKRYQNKLIYNPQMLQALSIVSRWKGAPQSSVDVQNLELIAHLTNSGAGYGILPSQVIKAQRLDLKKVPNTPVFKDHLTLVCYPEMIKSSEGKMIFEALKKSFRK